MSTYALKVRCGSDTYTKPDGTTGTAGKGALVSEDVAFTMATTQDQTLVTRAYGITSQSSNSMKSSNPDSGIYEADTSKTLDTRACEPSCNQGGMAITDGYVVRRLTPVECERLQGFPDGWTDIEYRGKPAADGPRYKALGNSMAVPVIKWLGQRIEMVEEILNGA